MQIYWSQMLTPANNMLLERSGCCWRPCLTVWWFSCVFFLSSNLSATERKQLDKLMMKVNSVVGHETSFRAPQVTDCCILNPPQERCCRSFLWGAVALYNHNCAQQDNFMFLLSAIIHLLFGQFCSKLVNSLFMQKYTGICSTGTFFFNYTTKWHISLNLYFIF